MAHTGHRIVRLTVALVLALIMVMALAGTALAFNPPNNPNGVGANALDGGGFPAGPPPILRRRRSVARHSVRPLRKPQR